MWCFCGAPSPLLGRSRGSQTALVQVRSEELGAPPPPPCRAPRPATSPPEPAVTRMCPHSRQWPLRSLSHWRCRARGRAWQPAAGRPASREPAWATRMTQLLCKHPQWVAGIGGQWGAGRGMESSLARWLGSASRVTARKQGGWASLLAPEARIYHMSKYLSSYVFIL